MPVGGVIAGVKAETFAGLHELLVGEGQVPASIGPSVETASTQLPVSSPLSCSASEPPSVGRVASVPASRVPVSAAPLSIVPLSDALSVPPSELVASVPASRCASVSASVGWPASAAASLDPSWVPASVEPSSAPPSCGEPPVAKEEPPHAVTTNSHAHRPPRIHC